MCECVFERESLLVRVCVFACLASLFAELERKNVWKEEQMDERRER